MPINQTAFPPMWVLTPPEHSVQLGGPRKIFYYNHPGNIKKKMKKKKKKKPSEKRARLICDYDHQLSPAAGGQKCMAPDPLPRTPATFHVNTSNPQACLINHPA